MIMISKKLKNKLNLMILKIPLKNPIATILTLFDADNLFTNNINNEINADKYNNLYFNMKVRQISFPRNNIDNSKIL